MQLFGGNGKKGRHSSANSGGRDRGYTEPPAAPAEEYSEAAAPHYDDDYDYARRYARRMERIEHNRAGGAGERRFASDDIISREERRAARPKWPRRLAAVLCVIAILCVGLYGGYRIWAVAPQTEQGGLNDYRDETPAETDGAVAPESAVDKRDGVWTFFIAGIDVVGNHNDTNMVGMFDTVEGKLNIVSLPRDMLVNVDLNVKKINQPYAADINNGGDGVEPLLDCIADIIGYRVDMYALIDINAAAEIVDAIGGVYFDIPYDMDWDAPDQDPPLHIHIKAGPQTLDGENFVHAMRFRMSNDGSNTYAGGDIERIQFQQELLMALADQTLKLGNIGKIGDVYNAIMDNMVTNVSLGNVMYLLEKFIGLSSDSITFQTIPNRMDGMIHGLNYVMPKIDEWLVMLNDCLNPFDVPITEENINMISLIDGEWTMTQGYIAGGEESFRRF